MPRRSGRQDEDERGSLAFALGDYHKFLNAEEAFAATVDERIASVWPFIVGKVRKFARSLSARELANFEEDDILIEVWLAIRERDHKYTPELGLYVSFAGPIVGHCLYRIRERSRTVESAKNSQCRLKQYDREELAGQMTASKRSTRECILRTLGGSRQINLETDDVGSSKSSIDDLESTEERQKAQAVVMGAIGELTAYEAVVLGAAEGLWGREKKTMRQVSDEHGRTAGKTRMAKRSAYDKVRKFIEQTTGDPNGKRTEQDDHVRNGSDPKLGQSPPKVQPDPPLGAYRARKSRGRG